MSAPSKHDREAVGAFARDLAELQGLTSRQRQWKRLRQAIDRGEYSDAEKATICTCHKPTCVVHGDMPPAKHRKAASLILASVAVLGVRVAFATGAGASAQELLVGDSSTAGCSSSAITVEYDVEYVATLGGYGVTAAHLSGIDEACFGYDVTVSLNGPAGDLLAEVTAAIDAGRMSLQVPADQVVSAEELAGVSVVVKGAQT